MSTSKRSISLLAAAFAALVASAGAQQTSDSAQEATAQKDWKAITRQVIGVIAGGDPHAATDAMKALSADWGRAAKLLATLQEKFKGIAKQVQVEAGDKPDSEAVKVASGLLADAMTSDGDAATTKFLGQPGAHAALQAFGKRLGGYRKSAMLSYIQAQINTRAKFAGQYTGLRKLGDGVPEMLLHTVENPPQRVSDYVRGVLLSAIRDVADKLGDKQLDRIDELAGDDFEDEGVQDMATYVLYHYGRKERLQKRIADLGKQAEKPGRAREAWQSLASLYWEVRDYDNAVAAYKKAEPHVADLSDQERGTFYYNMACSQSLGGKIDGAFSSLAKALETWGSGANPTLLKVDHDISNLRKDPRFAELMKKHGLESVLQPAKKAGKSDSKGNGDR